MTKSVLPFLMFEGQAEAAMRFWAAVFPEGEILELERFGDGQPGAETKVRRGLFRLNDQTVIVFDSPVQHAFGLTPSFSFFVECDSEAEIERLNAAIGEDRQAFMPLGDYGFSRRFCWVADPFG